MQSMTAIKKFEKIGNELGVIFSTEDLKRIGIDDPSEAEIEITALEGRIILRPAKKESKKNPKSF